MLYQKQEGDVMLGIHISKMRTLRYNIVHGLANVLDGLIRIISLGSLYTSYPLKASRIRAKAEILNQKAKWEAHVKNTSET